MTRFTTDLHRLAGDGNRAHVIIEADGTISWVNRATTVLLDLSQEQLIGRPFLDLVHAEDRATDPPVAAATLRLRDGDGRWRRVSIRRHATPTTENGAGFDVVQLRAADEPQILDLDAPF